MTFTTINIFGELDRLLKEQDEKKKQRDEYKNNLDVDKIREGINSFDVETYKQQLTDYALSQNVTMTWVDESYCGGFDGNGNIRNEDEFGVGQEIKTPKEWFTHMMISTDHTNNIVAYFRLVDFNDPTEIPIQVIYFTFLPNVEHLAI
jgi:hypothetical protein